MARNFHFTIQHEWKALAGRVFVKQYGPDWHGHGACRAAQVRQRRRDVRQSGVEADGVSHAGSLALPPVFPSGKRHPPKKFLKTGERWRPYRGVAAHMLWAYINATRDAQRGGA